MFLRGSQEVTEETGTLAHLALVLILYLFTCCICFSSYPNKSTAQSMYLFHLQMQVMVNKMGPNQR